MLNSVEEFEYAPATADREGDTVPRDRAPRQPHRMPNAVKLASHAALYFIRVFIKINRAVLR